jgi:hypothetical protein
MPALRKGIVRLTFLIPIKDLTTLVLSYQSDADQSFIALLFCEKPNVVF